MTDPISTNRGPLLYQDAYAARMTFVEKLSETLNAVCREHLATGKPSEDNGKLMLAKAIRLVLTDEVVKTSMTDVEQFGIET